MWPKLHGMFYKSPKFSAIGIFILAFWGIYHYTPPVAMLRKEMRFVYRNHIFYCNVKGFSGQTLYSFDDSNPAVVLGNRCLDWSVSSLFVVR